MPRTCILISLIAILYLIYLISDPNGYNIYNNHILYFYRYYSLAVIIVIGFFAIIMCPAPIFLPTLTEIFRSSVSYFLLSSIFIILTALSITMVFDTICPIFFSDNILRIFSIFFVPPINALLKSKFNNIFSASSFMISQFLILNLSKFFFSGIYGII